MVVGGVTLELPRRHQRVDQTGDILIGNVLPKERKSTPDGRLRNAVVIVEDPDAQNQSLIHNQLYSRKEQLHCILHIVPPPVHAL